MKKILSWGLMLAAAFTLTNCAKEITNPDQQPETAGYPFEISASVVDTKTVNDGIKTKWVAGDQVNLFHAVCDMTEYKNDGAFTISNADASKFGGSICEALDPTEEYDWYAFYPYTSTLETPKNTTVAINIGTGLVQDGYNSMAHLAGEAMPLYGKAVAVPGADMPSIQMNQLASVIAVNVTNNTAAPIEVNEVEFFADGNYLTGTYYVDFSGASVEYKTAQAQVTATVTVNNATSLAVGATATVYIPIAPFGGYEGDTMTLTVNDLTKEIFLSKDVDFTAGRIKNLNFSYEVEEPAGPQAITVKEFLALSVGTTEYQLTGVIEGTYNTTYGNFYLNDGTGKVLVYGLTATKVTSNDKSFASLGLKDGDTLTLIGTRADYNGTAQVGGPAYYVSHIPAAAAPEINCADNFITITTTEQNAIIYYTLNGETPTTASSVYAEPIELKEGDEYVVNAIVVAEGKTTSPVASRLCKWVDPNASVGTPSSVACYTLSTASAQGSNNSYAGNCDVTQNGIKWNFNGNTQINPWRLGGKGITKVDRTVYSKTAYPDPLSKVEFVSGTITATWNSLKLIYSTNADFSDGQTIEASAVGASKTIEFAPDGGFPAGCYFKFVLNITNSSTSSNKYVQMKEIRFYGYE